MALIVRIFALVLALALPACGPEDPLTIEIVDGGVRASVPVLRVRVVDTKGMVLLDRRLPAPVDRLELGPIPGGVPLRIEVWDGAGRRTEAEVEVPGDPIPLRLAVELPSGQPPLPWDEGARWQIDAPVGSAVPVTLRIDALQAGVADIQVGPRHLQHRFQAAGERWAEPITLPAGTEHPLSIRFAGTTQQATVMVHARDGAALRDGITLESRAFPADDQGEADDARTPARIELPSTLFARVHSALGFGRGVRDREIPWAYEGAVLHNAGTSDRHVVLGLVIEGTDGLPHPRFRPHLRGVATADQVVTALVRVPAGERVTAALPIFMDEAGLTPQEVRRRLTVRPLGSPLPIADDRRPAWISRPPAWVSLAFVVSLVGGGIGTLLLARGLSPLLRRTPTVELVTVALFGGLRFAVSTVAQLVSILLAAALGPLSPLIVGVFDDTLRAAVLAVLIGLLPRPGLGALSALLSAALGWLALGGMQPADLLFVGCHALWLEGSLRAFGVTRADPQWKPGTPSLLAAIVVAGLLSVLTGISLHVVLYRLHFAPWYVLLAVVLQGVVYPSLGVILARPLTRALREIAP